MSLSKKIIWIIVIVILLSGLIFLNKRTMREVVFNVYYEDNNWGEIVEQLEDITGADRSNLFIEKSFILNTDGAILESVHMNLCDLQNNKRYAFYYNRKNGRSTQISYIDMDDTYNEEALAEIEYIFNVLDTYDLETLGEGLIGESYMIGLEVINYEINVAEESGIINFKYIDAEGIRKVEETEVFSGKNIAVIVSDNQEVNFHILDESVLQ